MCDYEFTAGSQIRIMPDVHAGKGCTIGTTMTVVDKAVPNVVGVDIGCGMYTVKLAQREIDLERLDEAAHSAGRILSRTAAKEQLDVEEYRREMAGIYSTSVNEATLDEAPMAYKSLSDIIDVIAGSVDVIEVLKPIYNFKAN